MQLKNIVISALLLACFVSVRPAIAQGTFGMFPDPISHSELMEYADLLELSSDQRASLEGPHDLYLASMRDIRANDISDAMGDMMTFAGTVPDVEQFEKFQLKQRKVNEKIARQESEFFDSIVAILTDEQLGSIERVRHRRERVRLGSILKSGNMMMPMASTVDLISIVRIVSIKDADRLALEPVLADYEASLTKQFRRLWVVSQESNKAIVEVLSTVDMPDFEGDVSRESIEQFMTTLQKTSQAIHDEYTSDFSRINEINEGAVRRIQEVIPGPTANRIRFIYVGRAHSGVIGTENRVYDELLRAMAVKDLEPDMRAQVEALASDFVASSNTAIDRMVRVEKKTGSESQFDWFGSTEPSEEQDQLRKMRAAQNEYNDQVLVDLKTVLGDRWDDFKRGKVRTLGKQQMEALQFGEPGVVVMGSTDGSGEVMIATESISVEGEHIHDSAGPIVIEGSIEMEAPERGAYEDADVSPRNRGSGGGPSLSDIGAILPQPISRQDVGRLIKAMALSEIERDLVQGLYSDYRDEFDDYRNKEVMPFAGRLIGIGMALRGGNIPSEDELRRLFREGRIAFDGMILVDQVFFENVSTVLGVDPGHFSLRQAQLRRGFSLYLPDKLTEGLRLNGMGFAGSAEFAVNLADVLAELDLSDQERSELEKPLLVYHEEMGLTVTMAWNDLLDSIVELLILARDVLFENMDELEGEPSPMMMASVFLENQDELSKLLDNATAALKSLSAVNVRHVEEISQSLPPNQREIFLQQYKKTAFPHVYSHLERGVYATMMRAQSLESLASEQRSKLGDLIAEYNAKDGVICEEMIELHRRGSPMPMGGLLGAAGANDGIQGFMEYEQSRQQLVFERKNLDQRTTDSLKKILNDAQRQQLSLF